MGERGTAGSIGVKSLSAPSRGDRVEEQEAQS